MNNFQFFKTAVEIPKFLYLYNIQDNFEGLAIYLDSEGENSPSVKVNFGHHSVSFHSLSEIFALSFIDKCHFDKPNYALYESRDSSSIEWLLEHSFGMGKGYFGDLKHYLLKHADGIVNVISDTEPIVTFI